MLQAPWDDRLWSLLSTKPEEVTSHIVNENLANRKKFRLDQERIVVPNGDPSLCIPPPGEWSGKYQEMPCVANQEHEVKCKISFKADGAVDGFFSCTDGDFKIQGMYDLSTGIVGWSQFPINPRPGAKATEFYGDVYNLTSGPSRISGTFLTSTGRYCILNLVNPLPGLASDAKEVQPAQKPGRGRLASPAIKEEEADPDHYDPDALPTLLAGKLQPILGAKNIVYKNTKFVSNGGLIL